MPLVKAIAPVEKSPTFAATNAYPFDAIRWSGESSREKSLMRGLVSASGTCDARAATSACVEIGGNPGRPGSGPGKGKLARLHSLKGLKLTELDCGWSQVRDLTQFYVLWALMGIVMAEDAIGLSSILVLNQPGVSLNQCQFRLLSYERADEIVAVGEGDGGSEVLFLADRVGHRLTCRDIDLEAMHIAGRLPRRILARQFEVRPSGMLNHDDAVGIVAVGDGVRLRVLDPGGRVEDALDRLY